MLQAGEPIKIDDAWWRERLLISLRRRDGSFDEQTTGYRWIHGESDGWPGLVLDRYAETLILKIYAAIWPPRLEEVVDLIQTQLNPERIVLRASRNLQGIQSDGKVVRGSEIHEPVIFQENGIRFEADVLRGQKTGFFLDQRENRQRIETLSRGRTVLNAFSFSGGFSLYAARGGAMSVTDLDISAYALASAKRNFALNQTDPVSAQSG